MNPVAKFFAKVLWGRNLKEVIALAASILIALILIIAAFGKIFYSSPAHPMLDRGIGFFEILFSIALITYHRQALAWMGSTLVFSAFAGYALHWLIHGLPCDCMGKMVKIPTGFTFFLDLVFIALSFFLTYALGAPKKYFKWLPFAGFAFAVLGYVLASVVWWSLKVQL